MHIKSLKKYSLLYLPVIWQLLIAIICFLSPLLLFLNMFCDGGIGMFLILQVSAFYFPSLFFHFDYVGRT